MYNSILLVLSGPVRIAVESLGQYLKWTNNKVRCLYVKLEPDLTKPFPKSDSTNLSKLSEAAPIVYFKASSLCKNVDVRLLIGTPALAKNEQSPHLNFEAILTNHVDVHNVKKYVDVNFGVLCNDVITIKEISEPTEVKDDITVQDFDVYGTVCLGGTFDRLHNGHKVFLTEALLKATHKLIVGVSTGTSLKRKVLWELIDPVEKRIKEVLHFLKEVDPSLQYEVEPITDIYGPTVIEPNMDCLVVTTETKIGGNKVNDERLKRGMKEMTLHVVEVIENSEHTADEDEKISSSTQRMHLLGKPLKLEKPAYETGKPYFILFQGHLVSGKTAVSSMFQALGIPVLCCDEILQTILSKDNNLKNSFVEHFPEHSAIFANGTLDFGRLMTRCMKRKEVGDWFCQLGFEKMKSALHQVLQVYKDQKARVIIVRESTIFEDCDLEIDFHEIWATILPTSEAHILLKNQYGLSDDEAADYAPLISNEKYVQSANILFCSKWSTESIQKQVNDAYTYLKAS